MIKLRFNKPIYKILAGVTISLISLQLYLGIVLGYLIGKVFAGKYTGQSGIVKSIRFCMGSYKLHLHHWLVGSAILTLTLVGDFFLINSQLFYGVLGGYIFQGIICYNDWAKILVRQKNNGRNN